jgi:uncharacterized membrane protein YeaQ/YmgE (transglycosylase-associated protein family)
MGLASWVLIGAVAGLAVRKIVSGPDPGRLVVTVILGMAGASSGGFVVGVIGGSGAAVISGWSLLSATLGAVLSLGLYGLIARRTV